MKLFIYIDRINLLHKLIHQGRTGSPNELAKRLRLSRSRLFTVLDELKGQGAPISYSRERGTYFYNSHYEIRVEISISTETKMVAC